MRVINVFAVSCQPEESSATAMSARKEHCLGTPSTPSEGVLKRATLFQKQPVMTLGFQVAMCPRARRVEMTEEGIWNFRVSHLIFLFLAMNPKPIMIPFWPSAG